MRRIFTWTISFVLLLALLGAGWFVYTARQTPAIASTPCDSVQPSDKDQIVSPCVTVFGRVVKIELSSNGTLEIRLKPDSNSAYLVNEHNQLAQDGSLLVELTCTKQIRRTDALASCGQHQGTVLAPTINSEISYTGVVQRNSLFGWNELHPVSSTP